MVTCGLGSLAVDGSTTVTIQVTVLQSASGVITNVASASADQADVVTANSSVSLASQLPGLSQWALLVLGVLLALAIFVPRVRSRATSRQATS